MYLPLARTRSIAARISSSCARNEAPGSAGWRSRSDIKGQLVPVVVEGLLDRSLEAGVMSPSQSFANERIVSVEVADVYLPSLIRELLRHETSFPIYFDEQLGQLEESDGRRPADVVDPVDRLAACCGKEKCFDGIVHIGKVAHLCSAPDLERLTAEELSDPEADEGLPRVPDTHARADRVGEAKHRTADAVHLAVQEVIAFACELVDPVHVDGPKWMALVDGEIYGATVNLSRARKYDADLRIVKPACLEERELRAGIDVEIGLGISHRVHVARLPREIEQDILPTDDRRQARTVAYVGHVHADLASHAFEIAQVTTVFGNERVNHSHVGSKLREGQHEVRPDEAESTGDEDAAVGERIPVRALESHRALAAGLRAAISTELPAGSRLTLLIHARSAAIPASSSFSAIGG